MRLLPSPSLASSPPVPAVLVAAAASLLLPPFGDYSAASAAAAAAAFASPVPPSLVRRPTYSPPPRRAHRTDRYYYYYSSYYYSSRPYPPPLLLVAGLGRGGGGSGPGGGGGAGGGGGRGGGGAVGGGAGRRLGASTEASSSSSSSASSSSSSPTSSADGGGGGSDDDDDDDDVGLEDEIADAAAASVGIAGPYVRPSSFGGVPYVDTSALDAAVPRRHRVLFVLGGPGAGKGTQSEMIVEHYKCAHLSVGELLRGERARFGPHSELIEDCLVNGRIVPVEISLELLRDAMDEEADSAVPDGGEGSGRGGYGCRIFLVDGFPRNFDNLSGWVRSMPDYASAVGALCYDCPREVLESRILSRAETSGRSDDNVESARLRFRTYRAQTSPVVRALEGVERARDARGGGGLVRVKRIRGDGTVDEVWERTREAMDSFVANDVLSANARLMEAVNAGDLAAYAEVCDHAMLVDDDDDDYDGGVDGGGGGGGGEDDGRLRDIFDEYEVARVAPPDYDDGGGGGEAPTVGIEQTHTVSDAEVSIQDGTRAVVSYDRTMRISVEGSDRNIIESTVRETRVWSHGERGWTCVHFYRSPPV